jgi:hypothetical protein
VTDVEKRVRSLGPIKVGIVALAIVALIVPVVAVMAASPDPSASATSSAAASETPASAAPSVADPASAAPASQAPAAAPQATNPAGVAPDDQTKPDTDTDKGDRKGFGAFGGGSGRGGITITAIDGAKLSLKTEDGWTRTITVTDDTTITKGGQAVKVGDLDVGDKILFRQKRNDDGTFAIVAIVVPTPKAAGEETAVTPSTLTLKGRGDQTRTIQLNGSTVYELGKTKGDKADVKVGSRVVVEGSVSGETFTALTVHIALSNASGEVTAKTGDSITVKRRDGKTTVIHLSKDTTFKVRGKDAATLADIAVGDRVQASGTTRDDGSLDALRVHGRAPRTKDAPKAPAPPTTPG